MRSRSSTPPTRPGWPAPAYSISRVWTPWRDGAGTEFTAANLTDLGVRAVATDREGHVWIGSSSRLCGSTVRGNFILQGSGGSVQVGSGDASCTGNRIEGNLTIQGNSAAIGIVDNTATGNLQIQSNTGPVQVLKNVVGKHLQCQSNSSITGGANAAQQKQGQCSAF